MKLGKRVVVLGVSACGKSTFSRALAAKASLPLTHMDSIMWKSGWNYVGDDETVKQLEAVSLRDSWIIEGYIPKGARITVLERADTIIYLDYPSYIPACRYIKRWLKHRKNPRPELAGCPETFSFNFLHRVWAKHEVKNLLPHLEKAENQVKTIVFKHPKEASQFLRAL